MADVHATGESNHDSETGTGQPSTPEEGSNVPDSSESTKELGSEEGKGEQCAEKEAVNGEKKSSSPPKEDSDIVNGEKTSSSPLKEDGDIVKGSEEATVTAPKPPDAPLPAPKPKYDWYQTQADVVINIMVKKLRAEDVHVEFAEGSVRACHASRSQLFVSLLSLPSHTLSAPIAFSVGILKAIGTERVWFVRLLLSCLI